MNFEILGTADDGNIYFIDHNQRMMFCPPFALNKQRMGVLQDTIAWKKDYPNNKDTKVDWDEAINDIVTLSGGIDFDPDRVKGRGAWRSSTGEVCYYDGKKITGNQDPNWAFTRKTCKDIGLSAKHCSGAIRNEIYETNKRLLYSNKEEAARLLAWSTLAPFGGALFWRPAMFLTGASNSGKSAIVDMIIKKLLGPNPQIFSGGGSTEAGIRQTILNDASPVVLEETEDDTQKKKEIKEALLSLMRQSTSDDTPLMVKGTSDQRGAKFTLKSMFAFVGISPEVSNEADDNRLFRVNMKSAPKGGDKSYPANRDTLKRLLTPENTDGIRAFTFSKLEEIIDVAYKLQPIIQDTTKESSRFATGESLLISCVYIVWLNQTDYSDNALAAFTKEFYSNHKKEEKVNDVDNLIVKILDTKIKVYETDTKGDETLRNILMYIKDDLALNTNATGNKNNGRLEPARKTELKKILAINGLAIYNGANPEMKGCVAFAKNNPEISKRLEGRPYYELLKRHADFMGEAKVNMGGTKTCVIIDGLLLTEDDG